MKQKVLHKLDQIDTKLDELLESLKGFSDETLNQKPSSDEWSAMNVLHHLMRSERLSHGYIRKKLGYNPTLKKANLITTWRSFILSTYLKTPFKWKAPQAVSEEHFPEYSSLEEVSQQWRQQRYALKSHLKDLPDHLFNKELYKHPFVGRITLDGMIYFFGAHMDRHSRQIERTLKKVTE